MRPFGHFRSRCEEALRQFFISLLLACSLAAGELPKSSDHPRTFVIGVSPYLEHSVKDDLYRHLVQLLVQDLPLNSRLAIFDAFNLRSITEVTVPNLRVFDSPKTRANQFASAIGALKLFLAQEHPKPQNSRLKFEGALLVPQFCDFLAENLRGVTGPVPLLLLGTPMYQDAKEPAFSMADGYFPSDGHLLASREKSIFGLSDATKPSTQPIVHWVYFGDPWLSDLHKEKITRFWSLYLEGRGGLLAGLSGDLATALQGFREAANETLSRARQWTIASDQTKIEMLRITRDVPSTDWLTGDHSSAQSQGPPTVLVGPMRIGIRWNDNVDLDLYATPRPGAETLFFQHPRSPEGYYYKDHRSSPGREFEFIEFETPIDVRQLEAFVNFYKGSCPGGPHGEVRIEFDSRIYSAPFAIAADQGNRGRSGPTQQDFWTRIPVQQILKLDSLQAASSSHTPR